MLDRWTEILETLVRHRLRTALTALSVAWGIFVLVVLIGVGDGLQKGVAWQFRDDATNSIWIRRGQTSIPWRGHGVGRQIEFTNADYDALRHLDGVKELTGRYYLWGEGTVSYGDRHGAYDIRAVHPEHTYLENTIMTAGRYVNEIDIEDKRKIAVISEEIGEFLFRGGEPIGKWIDVNRIQYRVVGTFIDKGGTSENRIVYIPISTAQVAYGGADRIHQLMFTIDPSSTAEEAEAMAQQAHALLARAHRFSPDDRRALRIRNNLETWAQIQGILDLLKAFTLLVGLGTMMAGVVGVSNILLVSVAERTSEFGLRKALGATPASIVWLVLQEAILLTSVAGWAGLVAGLAAMAAVRNVADELSYLRQPEVDMWAALGAVLLLVVSGAVAGFFPAWRAARVQPVEALRS